MGNSFRATPNPGTVDLCLCTEAEKVVGKRSLRRAVSLQKSDAVQTQVLLGTGCA